MSQTTRARVFGLGCATVLLAGSSALAQYGAITGNNWLQLCDSGAVELRESTCNSYLSGFHESAVTLVALGIPIHELEKRIGCVPGKVTVGQLRLVVTKYLRERPERLHLPFGQLIAEAQRVAFPC